MSVTDIDTDRFDLLLDRDGDVVFGAGGDVDFTDLVRQAVTIRLRWFLNEWRFAPPFGMPYFEEILIKNPDIERVKGIIRGECLNVSGVKDITNMRADFDQRRREAVFSFDMLIGEDIFAEEVKIRV